MELPITKSIIKSMRKKKVANYFEYYWLQSYYTILPGHSSSFEHLNHDIIKFLCAKLQDYTV